MLGTQIIELENLFDENDENDENMADYERRRELQKETIIAFYLLAIVWSIGASSIQNQKHSKEKFNHFFHNICDNLNRKHPK